MEEAMIAVVTLSGYQHRLPSVAWSICHDKDWMRAKMSPNMRPGRMNLQFAEKWRVDSNRELRVSRHRLMNVYIDCLVTLISGRCQTIIHC